METRSSMLAFKKEDTKRVVLGLWYELSEDGEVLEKGKTVSCHTCNKKLIKDNLGVISKGSKIAFCDNPACYTRYLAERELEHGTTG